MADDEARVAAEEPEDALDLGLRKKKKKPVFDAEDGGAAAADEVAEGVEDLSLEDPMAAFGKKKKKTRKPKAEEGEDAGAAGEDVGEGAEPDTEDPDGALQFKKKRKSKKATTQGLDGEGGGEDAGGEEGDLDDVDNDGSSGLPWAGSSRDYHYEELLGRVFGILRENNPELSGEKHKTILKPPQVLREGTKKTVFVNFSDLCKAMHRSPEHVLSYLLTELGTSGSLDGQARLIVKGRFLPKVFEGILRRYINDYVICNMCKSADTLLHKENRLFILKCQACGASRSVSAIKSGFVARVGRRKVGP